MSIALRIKAALAARRLPLFAALAAALLTATSLGAGLNTEDYLFKVATGRPLTLHNVNLYDAEEVAGGVDLARRFGTLPWLTFDGFRVSFWRPLASLTHWIDYRLWPGPTWRLHLESILIYALLALSAASLYRRTLSATWIAGLAALLYAIDDGHGPAVGWLANRHAVLGALFGTLALVFHDRARRSSSRGFALLSAVLFALALATSELAISALLWIIAYALTLEPGPFKRRLFSVVPALSIGTIWAIGTRALGIGAFGSGTYIDPLTQPLEYFKQLPDRAGTLLLGQLGAPAADTWHTVSPAVRLLLAAGGFALAVAIGFTLWPRLKRVPEVRFFALGTALSLLPAATTFPSDRLLYFVGLGGSALSAVTVGAWLERAPDLREQRTRRIALAILAPLLAVVHAIVAPTALPGRSLRMADYHADLVRASDSAYSVIRAVDERLVVVNAPDYYYCKMLREVRWTRGHSDAVPILCLVGSLAPTRISRIDPNALTLRPQHGFLDRPFNRTYRSSAHPMSVGTSVFVGTAQILVTELLPDRTPAEATVRFVYPLESDKLRFVAFDRGVYRPFVPPPIGATLELR